MPLFPTPDEEAERYCIQRKFNTPNVWKWCICSSHQTTVRKTTAWGRLAPTDERVIGPHPEWKDAIYCAVVVATTRIRSIELGNAAVNFNGVVTCSVMCAKNE